MSSSALTSAGEIRIYSYVCFPSGLLWVKVYNLAAIFGVTPTLMCRSLETYGWIVKERGKRHGLHNLRLAGVKPQRSRR